MEFLGIFWSIAFFSFMMMLVLGVAALTVYLWWRIFRKAGFPGPLALLMLVPLGNVVMVIILAFMDWPALGGKSEQARSNP